MNKKYLFWIFIIVGLVLVIYFSLFYRIEFNKIFVPSTEKEIFFEIRIPRLIASFFVGYGLGVTGCVFQSIFLNPLCEGYTIGVSSSAALGVILSTLLSLPVTKFFSSFLGVVFSTISIFFLNLFFKRTIDISFVLAGVVLNFFFSSIIVLLTIFFDPYKLHNVLLWLLGSFSSVEKKYVFLSCGLIFLICLFIYLFSYTLDIIVLGKEKAVSLGVDENKIKNYYVLLSIIILALCVSLAGVIPFVGIFIPNFVKSFVSGKHKVWIIYSGMLGGIFLSFSDVLSKNIFYPIEVPISVFTGLVGSVFFVLYLVKGKNLWKY